MVVMPPREHDLAAENEALRKDIEILQHEVEVLSAKVAELEARLGQNSRSSSLPPSSDSPKSRAERRAAQREAAKAKGAEAKRARGKQPGAPGATSSAAVTRRGRRPRARTMRLLRERPHQRPAEGVTSRQVYDTPDPIVICTSTVRSRSAASVEPSAPVRSLAKPVPRLLRPQRACCGLYLLHAQHCSVERTAQALSEMLGAPVSPAFVASLAKEAAGRLDLSWPRSPKLSSLRRSSMSTRHLTKSARHRVVPRLRDRSLHVLARERDARQSCPDAAGVLGRFTGTMVHDRLQMYFNYTGATHAICLAHVLRDLEAAGVRWNQGWAVEMATLLAETNKACHEARAAGKKRLGTRELAAFLSSYDAIVSAGLAVNPDPVGRKRTTSRRSPTTLPSRCETVAAKRPSSPETSPFLSPTTRPSPRSDGQAPPKDLRLLPGRRLGPTLRGDPLLHRHREEARRRRSRRPRRLFCGDVWTPPATT